MPRRIAYVGLGGAVVALVMTAWPCADDPLSSRRAEKIARRDMLAAMTTTTADLVLLGDSLTAAGEWSELLPQMRVLNRGVGGDSTTDLEARLHKVLAVDARAYAVAIGINDLIRRRDPAQVAVSIEAIVRKIRAQRPAAKVLLFSVLPIDPVRVTTPGMNAQIRDLNRDIARIALETGAAYVDLAAQISTPEGTLRPNLSYDGLHLTHPAYVLWSKALITEVGMP